MRIAVLIAILTNAITCYTYAQTDSSAYQTQRVKINTLLKDRSSKFGQYDESLNSRTGIFGVQTKKDIKNSNEILRQIVLNDNNIFKELKILLEYKDLEVKQVQNNMNSTSNRAENYKQSIKKLQDQNELLNQKLITQESLTRITLIFIILLTIAIAIAGYLIPKKFRLVKKDEKGVF